MTGADAGESAAEVRLDEDVLVARRSRIDANSSHHAIHPITDRAVRIVIERVHALLFERAVRLEPIPTLPDSGRTVLDRIQPRRKVLASEQAVGFLQMTVATEHSEQPRCTKETRGEMPAFTHVLGEPGCGQRPQGFGQQVEVEGEYIGGLRTLRDDAVGLHKSGLKCSLYLFEQSRISHGVIG